MNARPPRIGGYCRCWKGVGVAKPRLPRRAMVRWARLREANPTQSSCANPTPDGEKACKIRAVRRQPASSSFRFLRPID